MATPKLTPAESALIATILDRVAECMIPDSDFDYVDNGNFILNLDKEDMALLKGVQNKL